jgi:hypothetical protein
LQTHFNLIFFFLKKKEEAERIKKQRQPMKKIYTLHIGCLEESKNKQKRGIRAALTPYIQVIFLKK